MTTYEEDITDVYYNLKGYFTIKNILVHPIKTRKGGKGRGEIDILAIKVRDSKVKDAIHIEVSVSMTDKFPWGNNTATRDTIIKKFFNDSEHQIKKLIGETSFNRLIITSNFNKKKIKKLSEILGNDDTELLNMVEGDRRLELKIRHKGKIKEIKIIPFEIVLKGVKELFKRQKLEKKNFQDSRYRAIAHMILDD